MKKEAYGWGGDAYPGEEPDAVANNDASKPRQDYSEQVVPDQPIYYNWVFVNGHIVMDPERTPEQLVDDHGHSNMSKPLAYGTVAVQHRWTANFQIIHSNIGLSLPMKALKAYAKEQGWNDIGFVDHNGHEFGMTRTAAERIVRIGVDENGEDEFGVYSDSERGLFGTPLLARGSLDYCRQFIRGWNAPTPKKASDETWDSFNKSDPDSAAAFMRNISDIPGVRQFTPIPNHEIVHKPGDRVVMERAGGNAGTVLAHYPPGAERTPGYMEYMGIDPDDWYHEDDEKRGIFSDFGRPEDDHTYDVQWDVPDGYDPANHIGQMVEGHRLWPEGDVRLDMAYHSKVAGLTDKKMLEKAETLPPDTSHVDHQFDDGWSIRRMNNYGDLHREGELMSNCFSHNADPPHKVWWERDAAGEPIHPDEHIYGYDPGYERMYNWSFDLPRGEHDIYSLRDPSNLPHLTWEQDDNTIFDLLGRHNTDPKMEHIQRVQDWLTDPKYAWGNVSDIYNTEGYWGDKWEDWYARQKEWHDRLEREWEERTSSDVGTGWQTRPLDWVLDERNPNSDQQDGEFFKNPGKDAPRSGLYECPHCGEEMDNYMDFRDHLMGEKDSIATPNKTPDVAPIDLDKVIPADWNNSSEPDWVMMMSKTANTISVGAIPDDMMTAYRGVARRMGQQKYYGEGVRHQVNVEPFETNHPYHKDVPGVASFMDVFHQPDRNRIAIAYAHTDPSQRQQGHFKRLMQHVYDSYPDQKIVHGDRLHDASDKVFHEMREKYPERTSRTAAEHTITYEPDERDPMGAITSRATCSCGQKFERTVMMRPDSTGRVRWNHPRVELRKDIKHHQQRHTAAPKVKLPGPIPFIFDIDQDRVYVGFPGEEARDVQAGDYNPLGIVEGLYKPTGEVEIQTQTNMPYTIRHMVQLWYYMHPELEVKSVVMIYEDGNKQKLAGALPFVHSSTRTLWRGLNLGLHTMDEVTQFNANALNTIQQAMVGYPEVGIHWTDDLTSAENFALARDPEGWAHENDDWEEGQVEVGIILETQVDSQYILEPGTPEHDDYQMGSAILDYGTEREITVRGGAPVTVSSAWIVWDGDQGGSSQEIKLNTQHTAQDNSLASALRALGLPEDLNIQGESLREFLAGGRYDITPGPGPGAMGASANIPDWTLNYKMRTPDHFVPFRKRFDDLYRPDDPNKTWMYDPELGEEFRDGENGIMDRIMPRGAERIDDLIPNANEDDPTSMYRGISHREWNEIHNTGQIMSNGSYNLGPDQQGTTSWAPNAGMAHSYAHGFAPWHMKATHEEPSYIVKVRRPHDVMQPGEPGVPDGELGMRRPVPASDITEAYRSRVYATRPGYLHLTPTDYSAKNYSMGSAHGVDSDIIWEPVPREEWPQGGKMSKTAAAPDNVGEQVRDLLQQDPSAVEVYNALAPLGNVYVVGGAIRDLALGRIPKDIDIMAQGISPDDAIKALELRPGRVEVTGNQFPVIRYFHPGGAQCEIALPRRERSTGGGGRKDFDVQMDVNMPVEEDLERRDFTGNSMAVDLKSGQLIDPYGGWRDLEAGKLKLVHPNAFKDDATRILRALSSKSRHGLHPDLDTQQAMSEWAHRIDTHVPAEQKSAELEKLMKGDDPAAALELAQQTGVLEHIIPELAATHGFDQKSKYHNELLFDHIMSVVRKTAELNKDPDVRMAAALHDIGKPGSQWIDDEGYGHYYKKVHKPGTLDKNGLPKPNEGKDHEHLGADLARDRLKELTWGDKGRQQRVEHLVRSHMFPSFEDEKGARKFLHKYDPDDVGHANDLLDIREADAGNKAEPWDGVLGMQRSLVQSAREQGAATNLSLLAINGGDVMRALGIKPGEEVGQALQYCQEIVLEDPSMNDKATLIEALKARNGQRMANVLDPVQDTLDADVFDNADKAKPKVKPHIVHWVRKQLETLLKANEYGDLIPHTKLVMTGSLTSYQWSHKSDLDVSVWLDYAAFPNLVRAEMIALMVNELDGTLVPGTTHTVQCYIVPSGLTFEDLYKPGLRSAYDLDKNRWIVAPERDRVYNPYAEVPALMGWVHDQAEKMKLLQNYDPPGAREFERQIHERRRRDQQEGKGDFSESNVLWKYLEHMELV